MQAQPALANENGRQGVETINREQAAQVLHHSRNATMALGSTVRNNEKS
jgi:hypothetical protein